MEKPSKQALLNKTHYGVGIYAHILRKYYPDEVVVKLKERDCGLSRNPFNGDKETLHIWIAKTDPTNAMSAEFACHKDTQNAIPAGDAFDFAELHYKQQDEELLQTLNKELNLRIGEERNFYQNFANQTNPKNQGSDICFSFFKSPISNTKPHSETTLQKVYNAIVGNYYKQRTEKLRAIPDTAQARKFKASNFDYCTFSGIFSTRNDKALIQHSNMLCVDFDHLESVETLFEQLLKDDYFDTLLMFRSPSGDGLKWIIPIDTAQAMHSDYFTAVANYILQTYGVEVDKSGRDISRACFLPHDPQAYINPKLVISNQ